VALLTRTQKTIIATTIYATDLVNYVDFSHNLEVSFNVIYLSAGFYG
jgi:hypothetical protein